MISSLHIRGDHLLAAYQWDLFGTVRLVRNWGRIGTTGQEKVEIHANETAAGQALEAIARAKRRRGYRDL
jgi:predicted DNA-binding WGR domain protein